MIIITNSEKTIIHKYSNLFNSLTSLKRNKFSINTYRDNNRYYDTKSKFI